MPVQDFFETDYTVNEDITSLTGLENGYLDTYGKDKEKLAVIAEVNPNLIWTVVDGDDDELYLLAGWHLVNRIHYVITKQPWKDGGEQYVW
jgi:hypothetical protein